MKLVTYFRVDESKFRVGVAYLAHPVDKSLLPLFFHTKNIWSFINTDFLTTEARQTLSNLFENSHYRTHVSHIEKPINPDRNVRN